MSKLTIDTNDLSSEGLDIEDVILEGGNLETTAEVDLEGGDIEVGVGGGGQDGRGIASIEQTTTSTEDGGINEVTQTLTDGTTAVFQIRNGSRGSQGLQGERGLQGIQGERGEKGDAGEDWIPTQQELASIASSAAALVDVPENLADLNDDSTHRLVTDTEKTTWNGKQAQLVSGTNIKTINNESILGEGNINIQGGTGGDVNVIEVVKVNGTALTPDSNKAVDVPVPTKVSDLNNDSGFITGYTETDPVFSASAASGITSAKISSWDAKSDFSGSYNDLADKPTIPSEVTEQTVSGWGFTKNTGTYSKPSGGIPKTDLESAVQTSLGKADTALQSFTESDPTVPSWAKQSTKPTYTASEVGALPASTTIPSALADLSADSTHRTVTDTEKSTWNNKSDFSGSYNDLSDKPTIPTVPSNVSAFTNDSHYVASTAITTIVSLTQAQYDALATKDANTLYIIPEE